MRIAGEEYLCMLLHALGFEESEHLGPHGCVPEKNDPFRAFTTGNKSSITLSHVRSVQYQERENAPIIDIAQLLVACVKNW